MRPLRYSINVTLDGCVDHAVGSPDEEIHQHYAQAIARADALVLGRVTYEMMESAWRPPLRENGLPEWMEPFAVSMRGARKYVASTTLSDVDWNAELLTGDVVEAVRRLKQEPGDGLHLGGVRFPLVLARAGLIDEYEFVVHPTVAGHGPWLLDGLERPLGLRATGSRTFASGAIATTYIPTR